MEQRAREAQTECGGLPHCRVTSAEQGPWCVLARGPGLPRVRVSSKQGRVHLQDCHDHLRVNKAQPRSGNHHHRPGLQPGSLKSPGLVQDFTQQKSTEVLLCDDGARSPTRGPAGEHS